MWPLALQNLINSSLNMINTLMIGQNGEVAVAERPGRIVGHLDVLARAVEQEAVGHLSGGEAGAVVEGAVAPADQVDRVAIARPPGDQTRRRRQANGAAPGPPVRWRAQG